MAEHCCDLVATCKYRKHTINSYKMGPLSPTVFNFPSVFQSMSVLRADMLKKIRLLYNVIITKQIQFPVEDKLFAEWKHYTWN